MKNEKRVSEDHHLRRRHRHRNFRLCGRSLRTAQRSPSGSGHRRSRGMLTEHPSRGADRGVHGTCSGRVYGTRSGRVYDAGSGRVYTARVLSAETLLQTAASPSAASASLAWSPSRSGSGSRSQTSLPLNCETKEPTLERAGSFLPVDAIQKARRAFERLRRASCRCRIYCRSFTGRAGLRGRPQLRRAWAFRSADSGFRTWRLWSRSCRLCSCPWRHGTRWPESFHRSRSFPSTKH